MAPNPTVRNPHDRRPAIRLECTYAPCLNNRGYLRPERPTGFEIAQSEGPLLDGVVIRRPSCAGSDAPVLAGIGRTLCDGHQRTAAPLARAEGMGQLRADRMPVSRTGRLSAAVTACSGASHSVDTASTARLVARQVAQGSVHSPGSVGRREVGALLASKTSTPSWVLGKQVALKAVPDTNGQPGEGHRQRALAGLGRLHRAPTGGINSFAERRRTAMSSSAYSNPSGPHTQRCQRV
jgi:hypothetical protein